MLAGSAVAEVAEAINNAGSPEELQSAIFEAARRNGLDPPELFKTLYRLLLGQESGPRLGVFILEDYGRERAYSVLSKYLS